MGRLALADEALMDADSAKLNDDMHLGRGDSTMIDRRRTTAVLAAVGVPVSYTHLTLPTKA